MRTPRRRPRRVAMVPSGHGYSVAFLAGETPTRSKSKLSPQRVAELRRERELVLADKKPSPTRTVRPLTRWEVAVHEAEHVTAALALGVPVERVTIHFLGGQTQYAGSFGDFWTAVRVIGAPSMLSAGDLRQLARGV